MLLKLGIQNKILKRSLEYSKFKTKNKFLYIIALIDPASKVKFCKWIGSYHPKKKALLKKIGAYFKKIRDKPSDYLYCPLDTLKYLEKEELFRKIGGNGKRMLKNKIPMTRYIYKRLLSLNKNIPMLSDDFIIEKIKSVKKSQFKGFVYDITVEKNHNFLIENGIVSSNCHDFGLALNTKAHMQQLIRTRVGAFNDSNWHSLYDLKDAYEYYKEGNETKLRKIILPFEFGVSHLPKIWVLDSAVDSLCHGSYLASPGISKLNSNINKDDIIAIFTLKNELICLGKALFNSDELMKKDKDIMVKNSKVFMEPGVYPKYIKQKV